MAEEAAQNAPPPRKPKFHRCKKAKHEHHGGAWKVAFADFMTAMFALFLVLWILTQSQQVKTAVASYFRHPTDYEGRADEFLRGNQGLMEHKQGRMDAPNKVLEDDGQHGSKMPAQSVAGGLATITAESGMRPEPIERVVEQDKDEVKTFLQLADELWAKLGQYTMNKAIDQVPLKLSARLGEATLTMSDVMGLKAGDVFMLNKHLESPADMEVGGHTKFKGYVGVHKGKVALLVSERFE